METFIKKAIEGGWKDKTYEIDTNNDGVWVSNDDETLHQSDVLLDPEAWKAVFSETCFHDGKAFRHRECENGIAEWKQKMLGMTHALIKGQSIEEYVKELWKV